MVRGIRSDSAGYQGGEGMMQFPKTDYTKITTAALNDLHDRLSLEWRRARDKQERLHGELDAIHAELYHREFNDLISHA